MDRLLPFGLPAPTAFYLGLYLVVLGLHVVFMNYVLAGTAWLAAAGLRPARPPGAAAVILRDWMPFALGAAITAGVAPLLFVQILYQKPFYTANLLLFHRWMSIVPILIVGFYLLYLLKGRLLEGRASWLRALAAAAAFACFGFTAWSWTENHVLALQDPSVWVETYAAGRQSFFRGSMVARVLLWFAGSFPTLAAILAWQGRAAGAPRPAPRGLAAAALGGLAACVFFAAWYASGLDEAVRDRLAGPLAAPWLALVALGGLAQAAGWTIIAARNAAPKAWLVLVSVACLVTILAAAAVREAIRVATIDLSASYEAHARAAGVGGLTVFVVFMVVNGVLIGWCLRRAARSSRVSTPV